MPQERVNPKQRKIQNLCSEIEKVIFYRVRYYNNQANHYKIRRGRDMKLKNLLEATKNLR